ncbi:TadE/TadG family type IV pilus assembly protein [Fusibacter paucivorans]
MNRIMKDRNGNAALFAIIIILCLMLMFTVISEYLRLQIIASGVRDALQSSVIAVATENYDEVYNGLREGYSGGYQLSETDQWEEQVDSGAVLMKLSDKLGLIEGTKYAGGYMEYQLSDLDIQINNATFATSDNDSRFEAEAWVTLTVPLSFGWDHLPPMEIRLKVDAGYSPKF